MEEDLSTKSVFSNINEILPIIGPYGRYQRFLTLIFCIMVIPTTYQILVMYFGALSPSWKCAANSTVCLSNASFSNKDHGRCLMNRSDWEFAEPKSYSIITQFDIHCDQEWIIHLMTSLFFLAWGIGALFLGWIADNHGRKIVLFPSVTIVIIGGFISAFSPNIIFLLVCRVIIGFFIPGTAVQMLVLLSEMVSTDYRSRAINLITTFVPISFSLLGVHAYFIREWKPLFIVTSIPYIIVIFFYKLVPESIRWLHVHGKIDHLMNLFHRISYWNKRPFPCDFTILHHYKISKATVSPLDLFNTRTMAIQSTILGFCWLVNGMVYYGISLAADDLGGSLYTNFIVISAVEFPSNLFTIYLCERIGRKKATFSTMILASAACIAIAFIPTAGRITLCRTILGVIGKACISISFNTLYTWSIEIYSTDIRAQGIGFLQISSRIGAACSPWITKGLHAFHHISPFILMGSLILVSAISSLNLPETKGMPTSDCNKTGKTLNKKREKCELLHE